MEASKANLINSITLITIGGWGYFSGSSMTALIPVMFGVVLLLCNSGIKKRKQTNCSPCSACNYNLPFRFVYASQGCLGQRR